MWTGVPPGDGSAVLLACCYARCAVPSLRSAVRAGADRNARVVTYDPHSVSGASLTTILPTRKSGEMSR